MAGRPRWWVTGLVLCLVVAVVAVLAVVLTHRSRTAVLPPPNPHRPVTGASVHEAEASALLGRLTTALRDGSTSNVDTLAADASARHQLGWIEHNVSELAISHLSLRYVDEAPGALSAAQRRRFGPGAWVGQVQLSWRIGRYDGATSRVQTTMTFQAPTAAHGRRASFVTARGDHGSAVPLWLLSPLVVRKTPDTLTMATTAKAARRFSGLARRAVVAVRKVLPRWRSPLVVEVPGSQGELDQVLGAQADEYDEIAAVTTTEDQSESATAPSHIYVNPPVFDPLGPRGSQVVLSHEATHVATDAAISTMPTWLLEGFADFVALDHMNIPVRVAASQILAQVRKHGAPTHLPDQRDFGTQNPALGGQYEAAWLACRLLAQTYGEAKLIRFYRLSDRDSATTVPFERVLHTTQAAFTGQWRDYLRQLAGTS